MKIFKNWFNGSFWKDGLSIDETKVSVLIITFLLCIIFVLTMYYLRGDITNNMLGLITTLVYSITGVNVVDKISSIFNNKPNITSGPGINQPINGTTKEIEKESDNINSEIKPIIENNVNQNNNIKKPLNYIDSNDI